MNNRIVIIFLIFFYQTSYSQIEEWNTYDFDSIVAIDMPHEVYEIDSIIDNRRNYQIYSETDSTEYKVLKLYLGKVYSNVESAPLPYNEMSLDKYYSDIIWVFTEGIDYNLSSRKKITKLDLKGYKLTFKDQNNILVLEMHFFIVNKNFYGFSYTNINGLNESERTLFFDSIVFNKKYELRQFPKKSSFYKKIALGLFLLLLLSFIIRFKSKRKSN